MIKERQSIYNYKIIDNYLLIVDNLTNSNEGKYVSLTNNMEQVLSEINSEIDTDITSLNILYRDTLEDWDSVEITSIIGDKIDSIDFKLEVALDEDYLNSLFLK